MNQQQKIESLVLIKEQLEMFMAYCPEWYRLLHGTKEINIAHQLCKKLIADTVMEYVDDCNDLQSLGLNNME